MNELYWKVSARLGFKIWNDNDTANDFQNLYSDFTVTKLFGGPFTKQQIEDRWVREIQNYSKCGIQYFPVFLQSTNEFIGSCGLRPHVSGHQGDVYELGFHFKPQFHGNGYAIEAASAMVEFAFTTIFASKLMAGHHPDNTASKRLLNKLGFVFVGDEFYEATGLFHPTYELTRPSATNTLKQLSCHTI